MIELEEKASPIIRSRDRRSMAGGKFWDQTVGGKDLRCAVAHRSQFVNVTFDSCTMQQGGFIGAYFEGCQFVDCDLSGVNFATATFRQTYFRDCTLDLASFENAVFIDCDILGGRAEYARFTEAAVTRVVFSTQLHGADLRFAYVDGLDLTDSNLWGASITVSCRQFKGVGLSDRSLGLFLGLLSKTAGDRQEDIAKLVTDQEKRLLGKLMNEERED